MGKWVLQARFQRQDNFGAFEEFGRGGWGMRLCRINVQMGTIAITCLCHKVVHPS